MLSERLAVRNHPPTVMAVSSSESFEQNENSCVHSKTVDPEPCPDEPNLYQFPQDVFPTYRPLPVLAKCLIWTLSAAAGVLTTTSLRWIQLVESVKSLEIAWKRVFVALVKGCLIWFCTKLVLQEVIGPPSRISTEQLLSEYFLPSALSKYKEVPAIEADSIGVHYLEQPGLAGSKRLLYVNHGFGASSLSWLPALPSLTRRLNCRKGLGHDAPGFGFTGRSRFTADYTSSASALCGVSLLKESLKEESELVMIGHSLGCLTTVRQALQLKSQYPSLPLHVILCSPALGLEPPKVAASDRIRIPGKFVVAAIVKWILRRAVGTPGFWLSGLKSTAWVDPQGVSETDALRYQWPSIGKGWEQGLVNFATAMSLPRNDTDANLLKQLSLKLRTKVDVIIGMKDGVLPPGWVRSQIEKSNATVRVTEMKGSGHNPFEEDVDGFVNIVEKMVESDKIR